MNLHFYRCEVCGKVIAIFSDKGVPTICCGRTMKELIPNKTDGASEKHVPVFHVDGAKVFVRIGSQPHPMESSHSITWIGLSTDKGFQFKELHPGDCPEATFIITDDEHVNGVYALCNLHGLWCNEKEN